jgi:anaerobic magnesium-protoporphyrin IX monomethyl ester cyclase
MKVLLTTLNAKYIHINLAIRQLYALNKDNYPIDWKEFTIKENPAEIAEYCSQFTIVAFSCYIWNITPTLEVAAFIKKINPNCKILLGGPEVSYEWQEVIANANIDFIITGEGEIPFTKFLENYPNNLQVVPSLVRKENGEVYCNPLQENFEVANYLAIQPYIFDDPKTLLQKVAYLETSRGCPYKCEFCLASLDNKVRYLPDEHIKNTLHYLMQHGKVIKFLDRTFNIKKDFTIGMFQYILDNHQPGNVFQFEITADIVHPDIITFINEKVPKGLFRFEIGIQTVNQKANLEGSRKQNFDKTKGVIQQLQDKIEMHLDLIVGLPLDTFEDIKYSFEEVFKLFAPELQLGFLKFLKGTPMRHKAEGHGYTYDPMPPYQIIQSNYLSMQELEEITIVENILEIYWNKGRALHAFKYITNSYSVFNFMQGFGHYFLQHNSFHAFSQTDVFVHLYNYAKLSYPADSILHQIISIDYCLAHKLKPQHLFAEEVSKEEMKQLVKINQLPHQQFRFTAVAITFDWAIFVNTLQIEMTEPQCLIIQYANFEKPNIRETLLTLA